MADKFNLIDVSGNEAAIDKLIKKIEESIPVFNTMQRSINDVNNALRNGTPRDYVNSLQEVARLNQELARTNNTLANNERELARARESQARALREESRTRQQVARESREELRNAQNSTSAYRALQREMQQVRQRARDYQAQIFNLNRDLREGTINQNEYNRRLNDFSRNASTATREANALQSELRRINQSTTPSAQRGGALSGRVTDIIKGATVAGAIDKISGYIVQLGEDAYQTIKILDAQNMSLKQIFETEAQVSFQKEYLSEITNKYGLELVSTTDAYVKYSAAVKGTYLEGEKARKIFSSFAGASAKLGLSANETEGIFKALEQMISKGKIQAEELRGQLGDRMSGAFKVFADGIGVSTAELDKMLKDGKVIADDVLPKVADRLEEVYDLKRAGNIETLAAAQNRFKNEWTSFLDEMSSNKDNVDFLAGGIDALSYGVKFLLDILVRDGSAGREIIEALVNVISSLFDILAALTGQTNTTSTSMEKFQATLSYISADINILASAFKYLTDIISNFFSTMFEEDGWSKFNQKMEKSADSLISAAKKYDKITSDADKMFVGYTPDERRIKAQEDETKKYKKAWDAAKEAKQAYFQFNGKYFSSTTGRNTGKSLDDYIDRGGNLVKKQSVQKTVLTYDNKPPKEKIYSGSKVSGIQKDYLKDLESEKKNELTILETAYVEGKISEKNYLEESLRINIEYFDKKIAYLKGKNASERKLEADANLEKIKMQKEIYAKLNDLNVKSIERESDKTLKPLEREKNNISDNQFMSETDKLKAEIDLSNKIIAETQRRNDLILEENKKNFQDTKELELSQAEKMLDLQDKRNKLFLKFSETAISDLETKYKLLETDKDISYEQEVQNIHAQKGLTNAEKEYLLTVADLKAQREKNNLKKQELLDQAKAIQGNATKVAVNGIETTVLTPEQIQKIKDIQKEIKGLENANINIGISIDDESLKLFEDKWAGLKETLSQGFSDLGLENVANKIGGLFDVISMKTDDFNNKYEGKQKKWQVALQAGIALVQDFSNQLIEESTNKRISELDKQLEYAKDNNDQEIEFLQGRIDQLNGLDELTAEQEADRRAMEDEQRALREQQAQREKQIEAQKARAEQKAAAQKALINGALGATMALATQSPPASYIMAALALAFGVAQSAAIMSKDPVPKYFVGTDYARKGLAWTDERGAEIHTDRHGNIKDFGSSGGARLKYLDEGDKIFTAEKSKTMMTEMFKAPEMQSEDYLRMAMRSIHYPLNIKNEVNIDYDLLSEKIAQKQEAIARKYTPVNTFEVEGYVYMQEPGKLPKIVDKVRRTNNSVRNAKD